MADVASLQATIKAIQELMEFKQSELDQLQDAITAVEDDMRVLHTMSQNLFRQLKAILNEVLDGKE